MFELVPEHVRPFFRHMPGLVDAVGWSGPGEAQTLRREMPCTTFQQLTKQAQDAWDYVSEPSSVCKIGPGTRTVEEPIRGLEGTPSGLGLLGFTVS